MCESGTVSEVDRYLAGFDAALRGPRRVKAELLEEVRGSLVDAASAYQEKGLADAVAQGRAVAEFGELTDLVPEYQAELAVAQGRRTALLITLSLPALYLLAPLMWWHAPTVGGHPPDADYFRLAGGFDTLSLLGAAIAGLVLLGYGWGSRYLPDGRALTRALGLGTLLFLVVHGATGCAVYVWSVSQWPNLLWWPPIWAGAAAMWIAFGWAMVSAHRCLLASREVWTTVAG
jgi:hypothetical protein